MVAIASASSSRTSRTFMAASPRIRDRLPSTAGEFSTLFELFVLAAARGDPGDEVPLIADRQQQHGGEDDGNADPGALAVLPERHRDRGEREVDAGRRRAVKPEVSPVEILEASDPDGRQDGAGK